MAANIVLNFIFELIIFKIQLMDKVTILIILANVLFSMKGFNDSTFFNKYKFQIGPILQKDYIRIFSSGFLHVDFNHLLFNMLTLYFFADVIINHLGVINFLIIYVISLFSGSLLTLLFHKDNAHYSAVGASGAVSGILFASILLYPNMSLYLMFIPIPIPAYIVGIGYLAYTVFGMKKQLGNIGHAAHLGGAIAGLLLVIIMKPEFLQSRTITLGLLGIPILIILLLGKKFNR